MSSEYVWHGLDYQAAETVIRLHGHTGKKAKEIFDGLRIMESAALPLLNKSKG